MTVIRAKVQVHEHRTTNYAPGQKTVIMRPVHAGSEIEEALQFSQSTPSGMIELLMVDRAVAHFPIGAFFNVDFTAIEKK